MAACAGDQSRGDEVGFYSKGRQGLFMSRTLALEGSTLVLCPFTDDYDISICKVEAISF